MTTGRGKVILFGEHAVVHGHPALAGALDLGVSASAARAAVRRLRVTAPAAWSLDTASDPDGPVARALAAVEGALGDGAHDVACEATVPHRAGLGSSAALLVAVTRAIARAERLLLDDDEVARVANLGERVFHGNPSGVDVAVAARGGLGVFRRGAGLEPVACPPFALAIGLSGEARDTAASVARVARALDDDREGAGRRLARLGELALAARDQLVARGTPATLGPLFDEAQQHLEALGVSSPGIRALCRVAREAGALGAKLTGAGGGGAVIAIAPGREHDVAAAFRTAGFDALVARCGVP